MVLRSFLVSLERPQLLLWNTIAMAAISAVLNYMLIFGNWGVPAFGIEGAAIASLTANVFGLTVVTIYAARDRVLAGFGVLRRIWRPDRPALAELLRLGWPISLTIIAEVGLFAAATVMMGWLGTVALAAHGIALQLVSITFMVPLGFSGAATVRIGQALGRNEPCNLQRAARMAVVFGAIAGSVSAILFWSVPDRLAALFLDSGNPEAAAPRLCHDAHPVAAAPASDSLQVTAGPCAGQGHAHALLIAALPTGSSVCRPPGFRLRSPGGLGICRAASA